VATGNEQIYDDFVRQQVNLQRMARGEADQLLQLLRASDQELDGMIRATGGDWTRRRLAAVRQEITRLRQSSISSFGEGLNGLMGNTSNVELAAAEAIVSNVVPVEINFASPSPVQVRELVQGSAFGSVDQMHTLGEWIANLAQADQNRILGAVQAGVTNGETIQQIARRVQQATDVTRTQADALARTAVNHASNTAREAFFEENADIISALRLVATLDGRTSPICRANDGKFRPTTGTSFEGVPTPHLESPNLRPPLHVRCRSLLIAFLNDESIADQLADIERTTVRDTRTGRRRQLDFEKQARGRYNAQRGDGDPPWDDLPADRKAPYRRQVRDEWAAENIGSVPAEMTYDEWLRKQPKRFQDEVLGPARAEKFREGVPMDKFIDRDGRLLSIDELDDISPGPKVLAPPEPEPPPPSRADTVRNDRLADVDLEEEQAAIDRSTAEQQLAEAEEMKRNARPGTFDKEIADTRIENAKRRLAEIDDQAADFAQRRREIELRHQLDKEREFWNSQDWDGVSNADFDEWEANLTSQQRNAIMMWGDTKGNKAIRNAMINGTSDPDLQRTVDTLLGLGVSAPKYQGQVYRGLMPTRAKWERWLAAGGFEDGAMASASWSQAVARQDFAIRTWRPDRVNVLVTVRNPNGFLLEQTTLRSNEHEVLLNPSKYRILGVRKVETVIGGQIREMYEVIVDAV